MKTSILQYAALLAVTSLPASWAWLPPVDKIRGVNLGGLFVIEPWMQATSWSTIGCSAYKSEFDCVMNLGQEAANTAFQKHWDTFITQDDITQIAGLGLNTIRIPLGYWIKEDLVYSDSEHFPQGGFTYLERVCGWAKDAGLYIILDLHGAPGAQQADQPFTGQYASTPGFYVDYQYERAYKWLEWMTNVTHTNSNFDTVYAIEVVNEPLQTPSSVTTMIDTYYPTAMSRINSMEEELGVATSKKLHVQMMNQKWGSGNPTKALTDETYAYYDDHHYVKWTSGVTATRDAYMQHSCTNDRGGNTPVVVGEWSLSPADEDGSEFSIDASDAVSWYSKWWAAQTISYEKQAGWIFWSWKVEKIGGRIDWRWGYQQAVAAGVIPSDASEGANSTVCDGY